MSVSSFIDHKAAVHLLDYTGKTVLDLITRRHKKKKKQ